MDGAGAPQPSQQEGQAEGDLQFAAEVLTELEAEGHIDPEMTVLRMQLDQGIRQKSTRQLMDSACTRREEEEFPLALQKIQEVLEIDPAFRLESATRTTGTDVAMGIRLIKSFVMRRWTRVFHRLFRTWSSVMP